MFVYIWAALARLSLTYNTASFILSGQFSQLSPDSPALSGCLCLSFFSLSVKLNHLELSPPHQTLLGSRLSKTQRICPKTQSKQINPQDRASDAPIEDGKMMEL